MNQHGVQSARTQQIIKGDDTTQTHQIMQDVAYHAELSRTPVLVNTGDIVTFFYPLENPNQIDLIGYQGVPVGSYPTSTFTVATPGVIIDPTGATPNRGTSTFQSGLARTVRAEITRLNTSLTGNSSMGSPIITGLPSTSGASLGASVSGAGIPPLTVVIAITTNTLTLSSNATETGNGISFSIGTKETQYSIDEVDIYERGFPNSLTDTSGGLYQPQEPLNLT
jgi:hypothetical protein